MWDIIFLSLKLASLTTFFLLITAVPLAWWLTGKNSWYHHALTTLVTLPLVLPPTVLGFYLLLLFSPDNMMGQIISNLLGHNLPFSFEGLVVASILYSLPFMVQPVRTAFEAMPAHLLEAAATLGASPLDIFRTIALPLARHGILNGAILSFAHTLGEFGVILMIGGNIPGETRVLSIAIYDYVETLEWEKAHLLSGGMILFSFCTILITLKLAQRPDKDRR